jgi:hypothetical protein
MTLMEARSRRIFASSFPLSYAALAIFMEYSVCVLWTACTGITSPVPGFYLPLVGEEDEVE